MNFNEAYAAAEGRSRAGALAHLLSISATEDLDQVGLARQVAAGLPVQSVSVLCDLFGNAGVVGPVVPEATLRRFRKARKALPREQSERVYELSRVVDALAQGVSRRQRAGGGLHDAGAPAARRRDAVRPRTVEFRRRGCGPQHDQAGRGRRRALTPRILAAPLTGYRIGDPAGEYPVFSTEGAGRVFGTLARGRRSRHLRQRALLDGNARIARALERRAAAEPALH